MNDMPLPPGALAPDFTLTDAAGETVTRRQFRNKAGLLLIFAATCDNPAIMSLLSDVANDGDVYRKLNVRCFVVAPHADAYAAGLTTLCDSDRAVWQNYTGTHEAGFGIFMLDLYGGVDSQSVTANFAALPDAPTLLEWARCAMYRCSI